MKPGTCLNQVLLNQESLQQLGYSAVLLTQKHFFQECLCDVEVLHSHASFAKYNMFIRDPEILLWHYANAAFWHLYF